jgi:2-polyprenyl-3-methyl-5-hydroxy-6-metoxy-1,4-benzoquinol methylase
MTLFERGLNFIRYRIIPPHNMYTHKAERFYFEEYMQHISPFFVKGKSMLDIGCQMGRFTLPAARAGLLVTATDIKSSFFRFVRRKMRENEHVVFRKENLEQSLSKLLSESFDIVMCLELLYNLPDPAGNVEKLISLVKPGGILITSHRTPGYYVYRFIRERNYNGVSLILNGSHPNYNAQSREEIMQIYAAAGIQIRNLVPVGMFSGFGKDTFSGIANPKKLNLSDLESLFNLETDTGLSQLFGNNARYWLVVSEKKLQ